MAGKAKQGLSKHETKGYRISIGKKPDGGARTFWLGHDREVANHAATMYRRNWEGIVARGGTCWTPEVENHVKQLIEGYKEMFLTVLPTHYARQRLVVDQDIERQRAERVAPIAANEKLLEMFSSPAAAPAADPEPAPAKDTPTLHNAIDAYLKSLAGKPLSDAHKATADRVLNIHLKKLRPDVPLADINYLWLDALADHFKSRPANKKTGQRWSPGYVACHLKYCRAFFVWLDDANWGGWEGPRKLVRPFRVNTTELMTPAEMKASAVIEQFDVPTLCKLYHAANPTQQAWMLTALFTGGTQMELSVLERSEFDLDASTLTHFRNKTSVEGRFWLPPELVTHLRREFRERGNDALAFRTETGTALVSFDGKRKSCDAVQLAWKRIKQRAGVPKALTFKFIRKFTADWMVRNGGESMGQIALSHAATTVLAKHYSKARDFDGFNALQKKLHAELTEAGMFKVAK